MPRGKKPKIESAPAPVAAPVVAPPAPKPVPPPEPESPYTSAELRSFIEKVLGEVTCPGAVDVGYCTDVHRELRAAHPDLVSEAYVRGKDLVVEVRSYRKVEKFVLEGVA